METATFGKWTPETEPSSQLELERDHDDFDCLPSVVLPQLQNLLSSGSADRMGRGVPGLISYQHFIEWVPGSLVPLCAYVRSCFGKCSSISFIDSTSLKVCHNQRIKQHKVFEDLVLATTKEVRNQTALARVG